MVECIVSCKAFLKLELLHNYIKYKVFVKLVELNIVGFKSFAKKTNIVFDSGMTSIVGPNGCGKSNVVDAIRWVMGEQKSGVLRSEKMENVIFNGSSSAKPVGMAEVSLRIENNKNLLPVDYSEVVITRRLFRSGESQYLINGNQCRLKDISDLFMDTGMAANSYSVIELPQVEKILNGKAEERRQIFEEAAGITRFKIRRKATFRKLEGTEKDLIRIEDIMSEVDKTVRSLYRQVSKAQRYQKISNQLKELEITLANYEYTKTLNELEPLETKFSLIQDDRESAATDMAKKDAEYENIRHQLIQLEQTISKEQQIYNELNREVQKIEERVKVNKERIRSLHETVQQYTTERSGFIERSQNLKNQLQGSESKLESLQQELSTKQKEYNSLQETFNAIKADYEEKRRIVREAEENVLKITDALSKKQNEGERLKATEENLSKRLQQLEEEDINDRDKLKELRVKSSKFEAKEEALVQELEDNRVKLTNYLRRSEEIEKTLANLRKAEQQDNNRIQVLENEAELLKRILENYQDFPAGVRHLATMESEDFSSLGVVANAFQVDPEHRTAIAAALGEASSFMIVKDQVTALTGIGLLKQEKKGIVSFLPLEQITAPEAPHMAVEDLGVVGWGNEIVKCEPNIKPILDALLGSFLVVQDIETAHRIFNSVRAKNINLVTLSGEVLGHWGVIRGGAQSKKQSDFLGRQQQLEDLNKEIAKIEEHIENRLDEIEDKENQLNQNKLEIENLNKVIKQSENEHSTLKIDIGRLNYEEQTLDQNRTKRAQERQKLLTEVGTLGQNLEIQNEDAGELFEQRRKFTEEAGSLRETVQKIETEMTHSGELVQKTRVEVAQQQSELEALKRETESFRQQLDEIKNLIESRDRETERASKEIEELSKVNVAYEEHISDLQVKVDTSHEKLESLREEQYEANVKADEYDKLLRTVRSKSNELAESVHATEMHISEMRMKIENLKARIKEEYEYDLQRVKPDENFIYGETQNEIENLKEKLKNFGLVNLLALKEYEQEKERLDFLQGQRDDLIKARENLMNTIDMINTTAREKFVDTFNEVQKYFVQVFKKFFEGGRANLVLREGSDPLESDIDIYAAPGGKKPASLQLLSGGEKSLTAVSLLFAIYLVKPSPFCILDEVDAPLDDQNTDRFSKALQEFSNNTQFIVVTHNKITMRAAHQMYGVTMEQEGVSRVVSVKFDSLLNGKGDEPLKELNIVKEKTNV